MIATVLVVDDEKNIRATLAQALDLEGYRATTAATLTEARDRVAHEPVDLMMLDVRLPDGSGLDLLRDLKQSHPELPVVVMSGHGTVDMALEAIRLGAHDFAEKPLRLDKLLITLQNALRFAAGRREVAELRARLGEDMPLLGASAAMEAVRERIRRTAPTKGRVLVTGESGTGKELVARSVHELSKRAAGPFVKLNCAAIPSELIESELFGHERGAFTGAHQARKGKFELAHGGTLFLDEIGDMRLDVQAKLLRALQEGEVERVGGSKTLHVDVRVVAATNKELEQAIADGEFREDLYYRLNVVPIAVPPLRARKEDLPELAHAFVERACAEHELRPVRVTDDAIAALQTHDWPGNVRELKNACERLVILTAGDEVGAADVRALTGRERVAAGLYRPGVPFKELVQAAERELLEAALAHHGGHVTRTAASLSLERSHLYKKMRALGIRRGDGNE